jgi:hypothetical protein
MPKTKLCKECQKKRDAIDWRTFPNRLPHYVWADGRKVFHFHDGRTDRAYCDRLVKEKNYNSWRYM